MTAYIDESLAQNQDFTSITFVLENADGSLTDLTSATATLDARYGENTSSPLALSLTGGSGITLGGAFGTCFYQLTGAQTLALTPGTISYTMQLVLATGEKRVIASGVWRVSPSRV